MRVVLGVSMNDIDTLVELKETCRQIIFEHENQGSPDTLIKMNYVRYTDLKNIRDFLERILVLTNNEIVSANYRDVDESDKWDQEEADIIREIVEEVLEEMGLKEK